MKKLSLNISERLFALKYLDSFKGSVSVLSKILDSVKEFGITPEEWEKAERKITVTGSDESWAWDNDKVPNKEIEVEDDVVQFLKVSVDKQENEGGFGLADRAVIEFKAKIEESLK